MSITHTEITDKLRHDIYPAIDPATTLQGSCAGNTILITGAGRGIGKAIAMGFALAGASTIVITSRSSNELVEARTEIRARAGNNVDVIIHETDVTSEESVTNLFEMLAARKLVLDVLVNNAGYSDKPVLTHEGDPATWWKTWEVNIKGTYLPTHLALKHRAPEPRDLTIICISSIGAYVTIPGFSAYQASKAGVNRFVEFVDAEYAAQGVRAFAVHPGGVRTRLAADILPKEYEYTLQETPELSAGFCVWLASQRAADHFRGKYVSSMWDVDAIVALAETKSPEEKGRWLTTKLIYLITK